MKVHGNYCGLNYGDATYKKKPIDALDQVCVYDIFKGIRVVVALLKTHETISYVAAALQACFHHDRCYDAHYLDCKCDGDMLDDLSEISSQRPDLVST